MNTESVGANKYRRVFPIFGLLLYYLGGLIASLEVTNNLIFLLQIIVFSLVLIVGLTIFQNKMVVILGEILVIVGSLGPIADFVLSIIDAALGFGALGGALMLGGVLFHIIGILLWIKE